MEAGLRLVNEDDGVGIEVVVSQQDLEGTDSPHALCCCPYTEALIAAAEHPPSVVVIEYHASTDEILELLSCPGKRIGMSSLCEGLCKIVVGIVKAEGSIDFPCLKDDVLL